MQADLSRSLHRSMNSRERWICAYYGMALHAYLFQQKTIRTNSNIVGRWMVHHQWQQQLHDDTQQQRQKVKRKLRATYNVHKTPLSLSNNTHKSIALLIRICVFQCIGQRVSQYIFAFISNWEERTKKRRDNGTEQTHAYSRKNKR